MSFASIIPAQNWARLTEIYGPGWQDQITSQDQAIAMAMLSNAGQYPTANGMQSYDQIMADRAQQQQQVAANANRPEAHSVPASTYTANAPADGIPTGDGGFYSQALGGVWYPPAPGAPPSPSPLYPGEVGFADNQWWGPATNGMYNDPNLSEADRAMLSQANGVVYSPELMNWMHSKGITAPWESYSPEFANGVDFNQLTKGEFDALQSKGWMQGYTYDNAPVFKDSYGKFPTWYSGDQNASGAPSQATNPLMGLDPSVYNPNQQFTTPISVLQNLAAQGNTQAQQLLNNANAYAAQNGIDINALGGSQAQASGALGSQQPRSLVGSAFAGQSGAAPQQAPVAQTAATTHQNNPVPFFQSVRPEGNRFALSDRLQLLDPSGNVLQQGSGSGGVDVAGTGGSPAGTLPTSENPSSVIPQSALGLGGLGSMAAAARAAMGLGGDTPTGISTGEQPSGEFLGGALNWLGLGGGSAAQIDPITGATVSNTDTGQGSFLNNATSGDPRTNIFGIANPFGGSAGNQGEFANWLDNKINDLSASNIVGMAGSLSGAGTGASLLLGGLGGLLDASALRAANEAGGWLDTGYQGATGNYVQQPDYLTSMLRGAAGALPLVGLFLDSNKQANRNMLNNAMLRTAGNAALAGDPMDTPEAMAGYNYNPEAVGGGTYFSSVTQPSQYLAEINPQQATNLGMTGADASTLNSGYLAAHPITTGGSMPTVDTTPYTPTQAPDVGPIGGISELPSGGLGSIGSMAQAPVTVAPAPVTPSISDFNLGSMGMGFFFKKGGHAKKAKAVGTALGRAERRMNEHRSARQ